MQKNCAQSNCPNPRILTRKGSYYRRSDRKIVQRWYCSGCRKTSSSATRSPFYRQKKRHLNWRVYELLCSSVTMRRAAKLCRLNKKTVVRIAHKMGQLSQHRNTKSLNSLPDHDLHHIQFDEMNTFEHTKAKPISVFIAIDPTNRRILAVDTASFPPPTKRLAQIGLRKYGRRKDRRKESAKRCMETIRSKIHPNALIESDQCPRYTPLIKVLFPNATHKTYKGRAARNSGHGELKKGGYDPIFMLNHTCAMFRANSAQMVRRTWTTTKKENRLRLKLQSYAYFHNSKYLGLS